MNCTEFEYSNHCLQKVMERDISIDAIEKVIKNGEIIKDYPDDKPYPSVLLLGFVNKKPLHVVTAYFRKKCIVITAYYPDSKIWKSDFKTKK